MIHDKQNQRRKTAIVQNYAKLQKAAEQKQNSTNVPHLKSKQNKENYNLTNNNYPWNITRMQSGKCFLHS